MKNPIRPGLALLSDCEALARASVRMSSNDASGPVKAAHKAATEAVAQRNLAAHKAAKEKRRIADLRAAARRRAEELANGG